MQTLCNYVAGQWREAERTGELDIENPSTGEILGRVPLSAKTEVDRAASAAAAAFAEWRRTPVSQRVRPLFQLVERLRSREEDIARTLVAENGKSLADARAEMKRAFENIETACAMPLLQQGDKLVDGARDIDGEVLRLPIGVAAVIAPFNFPAMVPFWFIPHAIATGNTVVVKASEQAPLTLDRITKEIHDIGLPTGVFNLLHGDRSTAEALVAHPAVAAVSVVGSTPTCRAVAAACVAMGKRFQAMGGAKNHLVVLPDAPLEPAIRNMITSCFGCAGQRCMASSVIVAVGDKTYEAIGARFVEAARKVPVGNPLDARWAEEPMLMGPVISRKALDFMLRMIETGIQEGARLALDGRGLVVPGCEKGHFLGPTVFTDVQPGMAIHQTEIFGPVVCVLRAGSFDEAVGIVNSTPYGNGASLYTRSGYYARRFKLEADAGMIGINVGIPAPVAPLPFGGMKASLLSDIKAQGRSVMRFYTQEKTVTERYWEEPGL